MLTSRHETPATVLIDEHYARLGLNKGWDNVRVNRLCQMLHVTPHELGKLCCISFRNMNRMIKGNHFPPFIALHFAILESWYVETIQKIPTRVVVPVHLIVEN